MIRTIATVIALTLTASAATSAALAAEPDNLILLPGFHAQVVADGIASLRHMAVRDDGVIYASTRGGGRGGAPSPGIVAIHLDADHKADKTDHFSNVTGGKIGRA